MIMHFYFHREFDRIMAWEDPMVTFALFGINRILLHCAALMTYNIFYVSHLRVCDSDNQCRVCAECTTLYIGNAISVAEITIEYSFM